MKLHKGSIHTMPANGYIVLQVEDCGMSYYVRYDIRDYVQYGIDFNEYARQTNSLYALAERIFAPVPQVLREAKENFDS